MSNTPPNPLLENLQYDHTIAPDSTLNPLVSGLSQEDLERTLLQAPHFSIASSPNASAVALHTLSLETLPVLVLGEPEAADAPQTSAQQPTAELQIKGMLGEGGMGLVRLARQTTLQRDVAVKQVKPSHKSTATVRALLDEAMFTGSLEHPNIIPVHALGRTPDNMPLLVMKKVEGDCWRDLIRNPDHAFWAKNNNHLDEHLRIFIQICNAVHFAHSRGIIHRDIKPENVMVGAFGEVYLMDWGIALRLDRKDADDGKLRGTPAYMAPEMLRGIQHLGPHTDIYLLGASLHEAITGRPRHLSETTMGTLLAASTSAPFNYPPDIPTELAALCNRACHPDPQQRFPSALSLRAAVEDFLKHRSAAALATAARARLSELTTLINSLPLTHHLRPYQISPTNTLQIYKCFNEAFFALQQSLREWPNQPTALTDLQSLLELMISYELTQRNAPHAASLLSSLPNPRPDLTSRLLTLQSSLASESLDRARLARFEHDHDLNVGRDQRAALFRGMFIIFSIIGPLLILTFTFYAPMMNIRAATIGFSGLSCVALIAAFRARRVLLANTINKNITIIIAIGFLGICLNRALGWYLNDSISSVAIRDIGFVGLLSLIASVVIKRNALVISMISFLGAALSLFFLDRAPIIMLQAGILSFLFLTWFNRRSPNPSPPSNKEPTKEPRP